MSAAHLLQPAADVLLVTVTDVETSAVFAVLRATLDREPIPQHLADKTLYALGTVQDAHVWLVRSELGTTTGRPEPALAAQLRTRATQLRAAAAPDTPPDG